ncbi:MAG: tol-pal system protein YbgF [Alphaproteobacteria bacterium]|nr:tol-pal system protein YbgF [Alphaproteobacteria bacterium]
MKNCFVKVFAFGLVLMSFSVQAQNLTALQDELDDIKEELKIIHQKVYYDQANAAVGLGSGNGTTLSEYDEIIRNLNGKFEELEYKIKQLDERLNTMNKDIETRFNMLQGKPIAAATGSFDEPKRYGATIANGAPKSIVGDKVTSGTLKDLGGKAEAVDVLYKQGLSALEAGDTASAEQKFYMILENYPTDKLAGNAQYWLGEVYYKNRDYKKAAVAFAKGYENYKNGNKGADSLYKLGISMASLDKKSEACSALLNLPVEFPKANADILNKAKAKASSLGCK